MTNEDEIAKSLVTIRDYIRYAMSRFTQAKVFYGHGTDNAWDEAIRLIFPILNLPHDADERVLDAVLTMSERKLLVRLIETRTQERIPVPYLTSEAYFAGLRFVIDERVLIPRSPIAELIDNQFQPWLKNIPRRVLDLCCGSGCIGIACAEYFGSDVVLADISVDALEIARKNISLYQLQSSVSLVESDIFDGVEGQFDLIVSNPPYVDSGDLATMPAEYKHEPRIALEAGSDGLYFANKILLNAHEYLSEDGLLIVEVGNSWSHLEAAYADVPFTWVEFERGGHGVLAFQKHELNSYFSGST